MARWHPERVAFARLRVERGRQMEEELLAKLLASGRDLEEILAADRKARAAVAVVRRYRRWAEDNVRHGTRDIERLERERVAAGLAPSEPRRLFSRRLLGGRLPV